LLRFFKLLYKHKIKLGVKMAEKIERNLDEQGKRGIQQLFQAEKEAAEIVEKAKQGCFFNNFARY
jgi:F0F1-type ATP synthase membrane subunit b/b'